MNKHKELHNIWETDFGSSYTDRKLENHDKEGELREKFIRESRRLKRGLEQNKEENVELKKSVKEKDELLNKYLSDNNNLKNENSKLQMSNKNVTGKHRKDIIEFSILPFRILL